MKRKILLTFTILILGGILFFYFLNKRIEGVWINHYSMDLDGENTYYDGETLTEIKNQKFYYHSSLYNGVTPEKKYFNSGIRLIFRNTAWEKISSINKDSLVIIRGYDDDRIFKTIMKRVPDSLKNNSSLTEKLQGNFYRIHLPALNRTDTIFFDNQLIWRKNGHRTKQWHDTQSWDLAKIDGFDILFLGNWPTLILKKDKNQIKLYGFDKAKFIKSELNKIEMDSSEVKKFIELKKNYME